MLLAVAARYGSKRDALAFARAAGLYEGPRGPRLRPDAPPSAVYPRHAAHLLLGFAELARRENLDRR
jgi:hypothetical protein